MHNRMFESNWWKGLAGDDGVIGEIWTRTFGFLETSREASLAERRKKKRGIIIIYGVPL